MSTLLFLLALAPDAPAGRVNNPGGERIPFVKLQSGVWDVVIRKTGRDRARIERVKAQCQGIWVNACASGVDPELRQIALGRVFQDDIKLSGDFTYCSTALVSKLPEDLGRKLIRAGTESFCDVFLDPESVRGQRSGNATDGENDLVGRLFGGKDTTSGKVLIKAPPTMDGSGSDQVVEASGERRRPGGTRRPTPSPRPAPAPATTADPAVDPDAYVMDDSAPPGPEPASAGLSRPEPAERPSPSPVPDPAPDPLPAPEPLALEDDTPVFVPPEPEPEPEPIDPELEALLAPVPQHETTGAIRTGNAPAPEPTPDPEPESEPEPSTDFLSGDSKGRMAAADVAVPAPKPVPRPPPGPIARPKPAPAPDPAPAPAPAPEPEAPSEFELEAQEVANLERLSDVDDEEDDKKRKKKRKKDKDEEDDEAAFIGGDEEFDNYIIIDIESLPEDE